MAGIGLVGIFCQWFAWWVKLPAILFLLLVGIIAGPVLGLLRPDALFGDLLFPLVSLSVAVILFEGGLTLKFSEIRGVETVVRNLVTGGVLVTWVITTIAARTIIGFSWELSLLFGAVTVVTGPTVIVPMLRTVRPTAHIASILRWEGIVIDPVGALLAVLVFEFIVSGLGSAAMGHTFITFGRIVATGVVAGVAGGYLFGEALRRRFLPEYLHSVAALSVAVGLFAGADFIETESGLLAVTIMGMWLANMKGVPVGEILNFKESLTILLVSVLFILLAARIEPAQIQELGWGAVAVFLVIQFIARPVKVLASTIGSTLSWAERGILGWIAPRGIVAAAIAALFGLKLEEAGFDKASLLVPLTFVVIVGTVVLQSFTARPLAKSLGVAEPEPRGFLIIGANKVARAIAKSLVDNDFQVLLADTSWDNIKEARMAGLPTYYGNPVSEHADRRLDLVGIGRLLALAPRSELNTLACLKYSQEFGYANVYGVKTSSEKKSEEKYRASAHQSGNRLFGKDVTYAKLASLLSQGAVIKSTTLSKTFDLEHYKKKHGASATMLFAINPKGQIKIAAEGSVITPEYGWSIVSLISTVNGGVVSDSEPRNKN